VVDGLGGQNRLDEGNSTGHVDELAIPSGNLAGAFVLKVLEIPSPKAPNRKGEAKVTQREGGTVRRHPLKDIV
jgi:hypothetical protein